MNSAYFHKKDFHLCDVPAPNGYPQSQTHAGVAAWGDYLLLSTSPYPEERNMRKRAIKKLLRILTKNRLGRLVNGEYYENPCLYYGQVTESGFPTKFLPLYNNPLMPTPLPYLGTPSFNSDPQVLIDGDHVVVFNRTIRRERTNTADGRYLYLTDIYKIYGHLDNMQFVLDNTELYKQFKTPCVSPTVHLYEGKYYFLYLDTNSYNDGTTFTGLFVQEAATIDGLSMSDATKEIKVIKSDSLLPWHFSVFDYQGQLYAVIACVVKGKPYRCQQMLGVFSKDLASLTIFEKPLTNINSYRGCALVDSDGIFALYSTSVNEYFKNDTSVDGRSVILATDSFKSILASIKG